MTLGQPSYPQAEAEVVGYYAGGRAHWPASGHIIMSGHPQNPVVAIIGAGFGGLRAARALARAPARVILIDRHNYHLFQPLLYQVATSGLTPSDIAHPVRAILRDQRNLDFRMAEVVEVNLAERRLRLGTSTLAYDYLIIAAGGQTNFFGNPSVAQHAFELKDLDDAVAIRNHVLSQFEQAALEHEPGVRQARLTFVVVGGGPTGVECAGALSELVRLVLVKDYPWLGTAQVRIELLEATDRLLAVLPERLQRWALAELARKGVHVRRGAVVQDFDGRRVTLASREALATHTLIWAAGIRASRLIDGLGVPQAAHGRAVVAPTLQLPQHPEVYVIGDAAYLEQGGHPLPMVAPVAMQQAKAAAENIRRSLAGQPLVPFRYRDQGTLATIGRSAAVARLGRFTFSGFLAWLLWLGVHIVQLIGFRNRLIVLINWAWDYLLYERAVRTITPE